MSFYRDLQDFQRRAVDNFVTIRRASALDLFSAVVMETPVDKGVLRGNWFASINGPSGALTEVPDEAGSATIAKIEGILARSDMLKDIYLSNNLPYAVPIEYDGISGKAPHGMVRVNVARWQSIVDVNTRRINSGI